MSCGRVVGFNYLRISCCSLKTMLRSKRSIRGEEAGKQLLAVYRHMSGSSVDNATEVNNIQVNATAATRTMMEQFIDTIHGHGHEV